MPTAAELRAYARRRATELGVDPEEIMAIGDRETAGGFNPNSPDSRAGAIGPMQLMPGTARELGVDPRDPYQNIDGGIRYYAQQRRRFGSAELAAAAYNAGPGAVQRAGGVPAFRETQGYVRGFPGGGAAQPGQQQRVASGADIFGLGPAQGAAMTEANGSGADIFGLEPRQRTQERRPAPQPSNQPTRPQPAGHRATAEEVMAAFAQNNANHGLTSAGFRPPPTRPPPPGRLMVGGRATATADAIREPIGVPSPASRAQAQQVYGGDPATRRVGTNAGNDPSARMLQHGFGHRTMQDQIVSNLGLGDELAGGVSYARQAVGNIGRQLTGRQVEIPAADAYHAAAEGDRLGQQQYATEHPVKNLIASGFGLLAAGAPGATTAPQGMGALGRTANAIGNGMIATAPYALANASGSLPERLPEAARTTLMGGGFGGALHLGGEGAGALHQALTNRAANAGPVRQLSRAGVNMTPGQLANDIPVVGPLIRRLENSATSLPLIGDAIRMGQRASIRSYNRAEVDAALGPIGVRVPRNVRAGRDTMVYADEAVSAAYRAPLDPISSVPATARLAGDVQGAAAAVRHSGRRADAEGLAQEVMDRFAGGLNGNTWKELDSELATELRNATRSQEPGARQLATSIRNMRTAIRRPLAAVAPGAIAPLARADEAYARLERFGRASERAGTAGNAGVVMPSQMDAEVRTAARGTHQYRRGQAMGQEISEPAQQILPSNVADSGTAGRLMLGAGGIAGGSANPATEGIAHGYAAASALAGATYSPPVMSLLNTIYRASDPQTVSLALSRLQTMAARNPALVPVYERAVSESRQRGGQQSGSPQSRPPSYPQGSTAPSRTGTR